MTTPANSGLSSLLEASGARLRPPVDLEAPLPELGAVLQSRFRVGAFLGSGGMGLVFQGDDLETDEKIVIKTLRPGATHQELQRFVKEATLELPENPHIVKSIAHFVCNQRPYYVQRFVEGHNLSDILFARQEGRGTKTSHEQGWFDSALAIPRAVEAIAQVADALQELHDIGVVHRDVKPANLVWSVGKRAVLIDFGLALNEEDQSQSKIGNVVGTSAYLAPELANGRSADGRSDLYSLAVALWQLLTGAIPNGLPQRGVFFGSNEEMDAKLLDVLQTALEPNRKFRFDSASAFAAALRDWMVNEREFHSQKSSVLLRRWMYFRRFEIALSTSILGVAASIMLGVFIFNNRVQLEAERITDLVSQTQIAIRKQSDFLGGKPLDDKVLIQSLFDQYNSMLSEGDELSEEVLREVRNSAVELGICTGDFQEIEAFLSSNLNLEWKNFEDARIDIAIHSGLGNFSKAVQVAQRAQKKSWPMPYEALASATRILQYFSAAKSYGFQPTGMYTRSGLPNMPLVTHEDTVKVVQLSKAGTLMFEPISSPGAFPNGKVMSACLVRDSQGEVGRMFYLDPREGPREGTLLDSGIYWQPIDSLDPPVLVRSGNPQIGLSAGIGLLPIDIDGDGLDEVLAPFSNSAAQSFLLQLEENQWVVKGLPGKGGDVHGIYFLQEDGRRQLTIATSHWNDQHQGLRVRTYDFSENSQSFSASTNLPLGAIQSWDFLSGWPEHSVVTFEWMDEAQSFGRRYRSARAGEIWTLAADPQMGLRVERKLGGSITPHGYGQATGVAISLDLDADGRDEIYWSVSWGGKNLLTAFLLDSTGSVLSLPLGVDRGYYPSAVELSNGVPSIIFPAGVGNGGASLIVQGAPGKRQVPSMEPIPNFARRVFTVRGEGPVLEDEFQVPIDWEPGDAAVWFEADLRLVHSNFDAFSFLAMEMEGTDGVSQTAGDGLAMRVVGGGDVYEHRLGSMTSIGFEPDFQITDSHIEVIPGGWVHVAIGPTKDGKAFECRLVQENGTPGGPRSVRFPIDLQPIAGAIVHWDWRSSPPGNVAEPRDETSVLAWDWLGPGNVPEESFALSDGIREAVELGEAIIQALATEDEVAFDRAKDGLEKIMGGPRVAIPSEQHQNSLARYYLEEYGGLYLKRESRLR